MSEDFRDGLEALCGILAAIFLGCWMESFCAGIFFFVLVIWFEGLFRKLKGGD